MTHKLFIGTMCSGENEYERSRESLRSQKNVSFDTFEVHNLPEVEAARMLYERWNLVKHDYDFFVQLDPDVVLAHENVLCCACDLLLSDTNFTSLQAPLHDFLSDTEVMGLNVHTTRVIFKQPPNALYTDRCTENNITMRPDNHNGFSFITPAGIHSPDPSLKQAFHFGVHRGLKNQHTRRQAIINAFKKQPDDRRIIAIIGFNCCVLFKNGEFNYDNDVFKNAFEKAKQQIDFVRNQSTDIINSVLSHVIC